MGLKAIELFEQMPQQLINERTYICTLNACSHSGLVDQAGAIFSNIPVKTERIYTTMVCQTSTFLSLSILKLIFIRLIVLVEHLDLKKHNN